MKQYKTSEVHRHFKYQLFQNDFTEEKK